MPGSAARRRLCCAPQALLRAGFDATTTRSLQHDKHLHLGRCEALVVSSTFFLAPIAFVGFGRTSAALAALSMLTAFISAIHWLDPAHGGKYEIDRVMARASGAVYTAVGVYVMPPRFSATYGAAVWICMMISYGASRRLGERNDPCWVAAHGLFHFFVAVGMCAVMAHCSLS